MSGILCADRSRDALFIIQAKTVAVPFSTQHDGGMPGPTNSGKTHAALERLKKSRQGLYCAPLRLLAIEIYENLNRQGIYCDLLTGTMVGRWSITVRCWMAFDRTGEKKDTWITHHLGNS